MNDGMPAAHQAKRYRAVNSDVISVRAILRSLWRHAWIILTVTALGIGLAYFYAFHVATPMYSAQSSVVLETRERSVVSMEETTRDISANLMTLNTEIGVLRGRNLLRDVAEMLNLQEDPEFNPLLPQMESLPEDQRDAIRARGLEVTTSILLNRTEVRNRPNSLIFEISVTTSSPTKSMQIANTIAERYIANQVERKITATREASEWLRERVGQLQIELQEAETRVEQFRFSSQNASRAEDTVRLEKLTSEADAIRTLHRYLLTRLQETTAQQGLQRPDSRVLSFAYQPFGPSSPRYNLLLVIGAAVGLFGGLALVFVKEAASRSIRSRDEMERVTGLPVIGELPRVGRAIRKRSPMGVLGPTAHIHWEAVNTLLTTLSLAGPPRRSNVITIVSTQPDEGKSSLTLSLALAAASRGKKTLIIDGDLRKRTISKLFNHDKPGLISVVNGDCPMNEAVVFDETLGADILSCEANSGSPAALRTTENIGEVIAQARSAYDTVIVDTSPVLAVPDALPFAKAATATLLLVRWNSTPGDAVRECLSALQDVGVSPFGVVMTRMKQNALARSQYEAYFQQ